MREGTYCIFKYLATSDTRGYILYFWVSCKERHASFLAIAKSVKQAFGYLAKSSSQSEGTVFLGTLQQGHANIDRDDEEGSIAATKD